MRAAVSSGSRRRKGQGQRGGSRRDRRDRRRSLACRRFCVAAGCGTPPPSPCRHCRRRLNTDPVSPAIRGQSSTGIDGHRCGRTRAPRPAPMKRSDGRPGRRPSVLSRRGCPQSQVSTWVGHHRADPRVLVMRPHPICTSTEYVASGLGRRLHDQTNPSRRTDAPVGIGELDFDRPRLGSSTTSRVAAHSTTITAMHCHGSNTAPNDRTVAARGATV